MLFVLIILGLVIGSFVGVLTWRIPRKLDFVKGRSKCPHCSHLINACDNIPLLSYLILKGKCRNCHKKISVREPLIELVTAFLFVITPFLKLPFPLYISLIIISILVVIFVIDLEHKIIYDEFVYGGLGVIIIFFLLGNTQDIYTHLLTGSGVSLFLLTIAIVTKGKGMGLGDVKLALLLGALGTPQQALIGAALSFLTGAIVGVILIVAKKAKLKTEVAFGPFLIIGFLLANLINTSVYANLF